MKASTEITLAIVGVLVIGGIFFLEHRAEANAKAFRSRFTLGGDFNKAIEAVSESGTPHGAYERSDEKTVYVQYMAVPPFSVHICFIDGVAGKIIRLRPEHYQAD
jgi:hypothetical protein